MEIEVQPKKWYQLTCGSLHVITPASHINNWVHIPLDGTRRFALFIQPQQGADLGLEDERAMIGYFQKRRPVEKLG